ncbi:Acetyltransferase (GNAT) family protein [Sanguibacter gelidistatuariae]|uniref:Acetyltransferase (GNAT) family protein n=1 Tax=Sanguibacter gelidistatuariae TaxID=1814289 RepID=A0A1G6HFX4_9MICO|nr:GNAT family N-acetyltransferase [Sanguibacter gelidistatuariae]SDB93064.1 Acetyltransferase (GNAT) family protein [Sanguibacter gelidistatuariae]
MTLSTRRNRASAPGGELLDVRSVHLDDPLVRPLLEDLAAEYATRYSDVLTADDLLHEMEEYPAADFAAPDGDLILVLLGPAPVAGGAFRRRTEPELGDVRLSAYPSRARAEDGTPAVPTAELKRIWTHGAHRRRGLARVVLTELERRAAASGYERIYLTTGPRQPEAAALYVATGYTPLFDPAAPAEEFGPLAFEKWLCPA